MTYKVVMKFVGTLRLLILQEYILANLVSNTESLKFVPTKFVCTSNIATSDVMTENTIY